MLHKSDKEKRLTRVPKPKAPKVTKAVEKSLPDCASIVWTSNSEWQCPFCKRTVSHSLQQCGTKKTRGCSAFRVLYGALDFAYKSIDGRILDTASVEALKHKIRGQE